MTLPVPSRPQAIAQIMPGLRRVLAPNPSPMTLHGTNTYIVGEGALAVIDPGPDCPTHLAAVLKAVRPDERISHILVTHAHVDHSPLARSLSDKTGAPIFAFGGAAAGRSARMSALVGAVAGGEGVDSAFAPDFCLADGDPVSGTGWEISALHTPGHMGNHLCFVWGDVIFSGDHVMGWASTLVSPPDGDMTDYMVSLERLARAGARCLMPGHGAPVYAPAARIAELQAHRRAREAQILAALGEGPAACAPLAARLYVDAPAALQAAARRNVLAHLIDLQARGHVATNDTPGPDARFRLV